MKIAQIAPLAEAVPPKRYGGTERVVSWLTEELVRLGHDVTLFASGDSRTAARLVPGTNEGLRLNGINHHIASHLVMLDAVRQQAEDFDIIHCHIDLLQFPLFQDMPGKFVSTLHGRLDLPDYGRMFEAYMRMPLISVSDAQRKSMQPKVNWLSTVHHGVAPNVCPFSRSGGSYLAFLGRICPEKRPDRAIEIAKRVGIKLKIAAKVDPIDFEYFAEKIEPLLDHPLIEFIGEIDEIQKAKFLGEALALVFPIDWREPFGLVLIEAMSAGTPSIAWRQGSVPEVVEDGVSGFVVDSIDAAVKAVGRAQSLDRRTVRTCFDARFTAAHMTKNYLKSYEKMLETSDDLRRMAAE